MAERTVVEPVPDEHEKHTFHLRYAVIPAEVFFDEKLSAQAKLLYPIIQMLDNGAAGCFASNSYLAKEVGLEIRQVRNLIAELRDAGHIKVKFKDYRRTLAACNYPKNKPMLAGAAINCRGEEDNCRGGGKGLPGGRQEVAAIIEVVEEKKREESYSGLPLLPGIEDNSLQKTQTSVRGGRPAKTPKPPAALMDHPAVQDYRDVMKLTPSENKREMIVGAVEDLELWGKVIRQWEALGFKKHNVLGMLESYKAGGIETKGKKKQTAGDITREVMAKYKEGIESGKIRGIL